LHLQANGFCEDGFVPKSKIISAEDLAVYKYSINANLFSCGVIEIIGRSFSNGKCALIGGVMNSLAKIMGGILSINKY
jgi:hypothetical protein